MDSLTLTLRKTDGQEVVNGDDLRWDGVTGHAVDHVDNFPGRTSVMREGYWMKISHINTINL